MQIPKNALLGIVAMLIIVIIAIFASHPNAQPTHATAPLIYASGWVQSPGYPSNIAKERCVTNGGYIYCVGGINASNQTQPDLDTKEAYFASIGPSGLGSWKKTTPYPVAVRSFGCIAYNSKIYCAGGDYSTLGLVTFYANLSSSGIGPWIPGIGSLKSGASISIAGLPQLTHYGYVVYNGTLYTVGGLSGAQVQIGNVLSNVINRVYSSNILSNGLDTFVSLTKYPVFVAYEKCVQANRFIYCFGGTGADGGYVANSYYANISFGSRIVWRPTVGFPENASDYSCTAINDSVMCIGDSGNIYSGILNSSGVNAWTLTGHYPMRIESEECGLSESVLCCVGGSTQGLNLTNKTYCTTLTIKTP